MTRTARPFAYESDWELEIDEIVVSRSTTQAEIVAALRAALPVGRERDQVVEIVAREITSLPEHLRSREPRSRSA